MVKPKVLISVLLVAAVTFGFGKAAWITIKAELAQVLIEKAWTKPYKRALKLSLGNGQTRGPSGD